MAHWPHSATVYLSLCAFISMPMAPVKTDFTHRGPELVAICRLRCRDRPLPEQNFLDTVGINGIVIKRVHD